MARCPRTGLTPRQARFVQEYLIDSNATQAAIRAGYESKNADVTGPRLLGNVGVKKEIEARQAKISASLEITAERVKRQIALKAFANPEDYVVHENGDIVTDLSKCTRDQMSAIQEFTIDSTGGTGDGERKMILRTRVKLADSLKALELLGRTRDLNLFADNKMEITVSDELLSAIAEGKRRASEWRQQRQFQNSVPSLLTTQSEN